MTSEEGLRCEGDRHPHGSSVRVLPYEIVFEALPNETIMAAALRAGYRWPTSCNGQAECGLCAFVVESGDAHLSRMQAAEEATLAITPRTSTTRGRLVRLACQDKVSDDVVIFKRGVRQVSESRPESLHGIHH